MAEPVRGVEARPWLRPFVRFGLLGAGSFALNLGTTIALHEGLGASEEIAFAVALGVVFATNFLACRYLVFEAAAGDLGRQLLGFAGSSLAFRGLEYGAFLGVHTLAGVDYRIAIVLILPTSMGLKFLFLRRAVFGPEPGARPGGSA